MTEEMLDKLGRAMMTYELTLTEKTLTAALSIRSEVDRTYKRMLGSGKAQSLLKCMEDEGIKLSLSQPISSSPTEPEKEAVCVECNGVAIGQCEACDAHICDEHEAGECEDVYTCKNESNCSYRILQREAKAKLSSPSGSEIEALRIGLMKIRDFLEFGPFYGTGATNMVIETDALLARKDFK